MHPFKDFENPPAAYRAMPFWFWNGKLEIPRLERQIAEMHERGIGGFFIHARFGLDTGYLSREWLDCVRASIRAAERLGMEVWLYDESNFPSGLSDLKVTAHPEYRSKFVDLTETRVTGPARVDLAIPAGKVLVAKAVRCVDGKPVGESRDLASAIKSCTDTRVCHSERSEESAFVGGKILRCTQDDTGCVQNNTGCVQNDTGCVQNDTGHAQNDTASAQSDTLLGGRLAWDAPAGEWQVMVFVLQVLDAANGKVFGVDYMNRAATELFIETTHEVYAREFGEHFGKTVKGFFVDEPTLLPWHHDISWYGNRPHARVVTWNYTLAEQLEADGLPASELLPHLFYTLDETSAEKRLAFYRAASRLYVDSFFTPYREWCDRHGLMLTGHLLLEEGLYCNTIFQTDPVPALASLHIPGTDHLGMGAEGPYGGWAHLPRTMTNVQGEKLVSSVSHLAANSRTLSETFGCAGWGLTLGDMKRITDWQYSIGVNFMCPHAFFYTIEGFRKADAPPSHNHNASWPYYRCYGDYVGRLSYMLSEGEHVAQVAVLYPLEEFQRVYEIGREDGTDRKVCDAFDSVCTVLPRIGYDYDIVHPSLLKDARVEADRLHIGGETFQALVDPTLLADHIENLPRVQEFEAAGGRIIRMMDPPVGDLSELGRWLREDLSSRLSQDTIVDSEEGELSSIRCLHRRKDGRDIYFLINTSGEDRTASISLLGEMGLDLFDLETGKMSPVAVSVAEGRTSVRWSFPPFGSVMFMSSDEREAGGPSAPGAPSQVVELGDEWDFRTLDPNCLSLDKWVFELQARGNTDRYTYRTSFDAEDVPETLLLLLDDIEYRNAFMGGMNLTIRVNDRQWHNPEFGTYLDNGFKTLDITSAVQKGANEVCLTITHDAWTGEPKLLTASPKLLGDFEVESTSPCRIRLATGRAHLGSWAEQGCPFYSGTAEYSTTFVLPTGIGGKIVTVVLDQVGDMFEAVVNGKPAGVRPWRPWRLDISKYVRPGENTLTLKVTNTMQNFLEGTPRASGLLGKARVEISEGALE